MPKPASRWRRRRRRYLQRRDTDTLSATTTGWQPKPPKPTQPSRNLDVENNANLVSSLNGFSGNAGVNIAAGGANQQSNTLSIAAGCQVCP